MHISELRILYFGALPSVGLGVVAPSACGLGLRRGVYARRVVPLPCTGFFRCVWLVKSWDLLARVGRRRGV